MQDPTQRNGPSEKYSGASPDGDSRLATELADLELLQDISTKLIESAGNVDRLYQYIVDAVAGLMRSEFASMQMLSTDRKELLLLAHKGFPPEAAAFWKKVEESNSGSSCSMALHVSRRVIVEDVETSRR